MATGCGANCMKYFLFFFNILFFLVGLGLVGIGAMLMIMMDSITQQVKNNNPNIDVQQVLTVVAISFMVVGFVLMGICFFGCCGAIKEVKCMLITYAILLLLIILGELAIIIGMFVYRGKVQTLVDDINEGMKSSFRSYTGEDDELSTKIVDAKQKEDHCCGADSYMDFDQKARDWVRPKGYMVPPSCCRLLDDDKRAITTNLLDPNCPKNPTPLNSYMDTPCVVGFQWPSVVDSAFFIVIGAICGLVAVELMGLIFAIILVRNISEPRAVPV